MPLWFHLLIYQFNDDCLSPHRFGLPSGGIPYLKGNFTQFVCIRYTQMMTSRHGLAEKLYQQSEPYQTKFIFRLGKPQKMKPVGR